MGPILSFTQTGPLAHNHHFSIQGIGKQKGFDPREWRFSLRRTTGAARSDLKLRGSDTVCAASGAGRDVFQSGNGGLRTQHLLKYRQLRPAKSLADRSGGTDRAVV